MPRILYKALLIKLNLLFLFFLSPQINISQNLESHTVATERFIGIGIWVNDYGIGIGTERPVNENVRVYGMGGLST